MSEFGLQEKILAALKSNAGRWRNIPITKSTSEARSIFALLGDREHGRLPVAAPAPVPRRATDLAHSDTRPL